MIDTDKADAPLSRRALLLATGGAIVAATLIVVGGILPAEFNKDPLGIGKATGILRLWAPDEVELNAKAGPAEPAAKEFASAPRTDVIEVPIGSSSGGSGPYELEYKVAMRKGAVLVYEWEAVGLTKPEEFYYDFHGHTVPASSNEKMLVSTHKQAVGRSGSGALTAPFNGIQGWYFQNSTVQPVVVRIKLTGFYDLVPAGKPGNEFGIQANLPAEKVRAGMTFPSGDPVS